MSRVTSTKKRHARIAKQFKVKVERSYAKKLGYYENRTTPKVDTDTSGLPVEYVPSTKGFSVEGKTHFRVKGKAKKYKASRPLI